MDGTLQFSTLRHPSSAFVALLYLIMGMADLGFSLLAFRLGVQEGNPLLAWMARHGLFLPMKVGLTLLATVLIAVVYERPRARAICWASVGLMVLVNCYHVIALTVQLRAR
jgi:hypothetical protein